MIMIWKFVPILVSLPNSVWECVPGSSASRAAELQVMDSQAELGN